MFWRSWQPRIDIQLQKATFFAEPLTQAAVSRPIVEQIATQHQAKNELELLHVYSTNSSLHFGDCAITQWPIPQFMEHTIINLK